MQIFTKRLPKGQWVGQKQKFPVLPVTIFSEIRAQNYYMVIYSPNSSFTDFKLDDLNGYLTVL